MDSELVSVVIPTYNREHLIKNTIDSVLKQTYQNFEIIVVDDGSTDNTKEIVKSIKDNRIKYVYQENAGAQAARNKGLLLAKGEYISFLDCADEWLPEFIEKTINALIKDNAKCAYCLTGVDGPNNNIIAAREDTLSGNIYADALKQGYVTSPLSLMIKTECFKTIGKWDENLKSCQDDDICFRLAKYFRFVLIPEVLNYVNGKDGTGISSNVSRVALGWEILWDKYKDEVIKECGNNVLARHYYETAQLYANIPLLKECFRTSIKSLKNNLSLKPIKIILGCIYKLIKTFLLKKEKFENKRIITILGFIKFSYKKGDKTLKHCGYKNAETLDSLGGGVNR